MFLLGITVRLAKWIWNLCASSGVVNVDRSKVAFLRTSILASTTGHFPLLPVHGAPSEVFCLLSLGRCGSELFPLVPRIFSTSVLFPLLLVDDGSTDARFGAMNIWIGLQVLHEDEEKGSRRQTGSGLEVGFEHRSTFLLYGKTSSLSTHKI